MLVNDNEYFSWLKTVKQQIKSSQIKAALAVNSKLILLYWDLGRQIIEKQQNAKWGSSFIEQLSKDLKAEFPDMGGLSKNNLLRVRNFYQFYSTLQSDKKVAQVAPLSKDIENQENIIVAQVVPQLSQSVFEFDLPSVSQLFLIPWGHHILIMQKIKDIEQALFYVNKTIENNWSRAVLEYQIETKLYDRQGKAVTNFTQTLPEVQSDLAIALLKDPYNFEFLALSEKIKETDLEKSLIQHITHFLLELGKGFAYMGNQYKLKIGKKEYRTDLLFYHTKLKCYVIIELKTTEFEPEYIGKLNYYVSAINELEKDPSDSPTIGILLCKNKDNYEVEFALKDINKPIGVSTFQYTELAEDIKAALPSDEEFENELKKFDRENER